MLLQVAQAILDNENAKAAVVIGLVWAYVAIHKRIRKLDEGEAVNEKIIAAIVSAVVLSSIGEYVTSQTVEGATFNAGTIIVEVFVAVVGATGTARFGKRVSGGLKKLKKR